MRKKMMKQAYHLEEASRTKFDVCDEYQKDRSTTSTLRPGSGLLTSSGFSTGSRPWTESKGWKKSEIVNT
jgi:hypothetical protein